MDDLAFQTAAATVAFGLAALWGLYEWLKELTRPAGTGEELDDWGWKK